VAATRKFDPETRERAVRMYQASRNSPPSVVSCGSSQPRELAIQVAERRLRPRRSRWTPLRRSDIQGSKGSQGG
jgi:hypothetical protein